MPTSRAHHGHLPLIFGLLLALAPLVLPSPVGAAMPAPRAEVPDSPVGKQLGWVLGQINGEAADLGPKRVAERFAPSYLEALPSTALIATFRDLAASLAPVGLARFEGLTTAGAAVAVVTTDAIDDWRITIEIEPEAPHRITELFLTPVPYPAAVGNPPEQWSDLDTELAELAPHASFLAAEIDGGVCRTVHGLNADDELAVGSAFKLYVLGELADQVARGEATWDELLAIQDGLRSLPSGDMRLDPAGTTYPLLTYAHEMIAVSDNTATDHLIARLGRENVEAEMAAMGHVAPERNVPLLATREWFAFKVKLGFSQTRGYLDADIPGRRTFLAEKVGPIAATLEEADTFSWTRPRRIDTIEWFASGNDLCRALASLRDRAQQPGLAPITGVLSAQPGIAFDARTWSYVGYKGGYETGVLNHTWLLQRGDGRWFALVLTLNDPLHELDGAVATRLMVPAAALLAEV